MEQKSTKWEYLSITINKKDPVVEQLNWHGHSDWELVQILENDRLVAVFKRPVIGNAAVGERPIRDSEEESS